MKTLHIVPGDSAGGSLLKAVRDAGLGDEVLPFRDDLSCGPIEPGSPAQRAAWWAEISNGPPDPETAFAEFWERVAATDARLVVWFGRGSARELAFFLAWADRVGERPYHVVDVQLPMRRVEGSSEVYPAAQMAVVREEDLRSLFGSERPVAPDERKAAARLWQKLRAENAPFRVVTEEGLVSAPIDYFDGWILGKAATEWKSLRRILSDAHGAHGDPYQQTGEMVLRARVVALVGEGKLVAHGDPWDWFCPIRLPGGSLPPPPKLLTNEILQRFEALWAGKPSGGTWQANPLTRLAAGDIIHATSFGPTGYICLIVSVTPTMIRTRDISRQLAIDFDMQTGVGAWRDGRVFGDALFECRIDSIEPLPPEVHNVLLGLDRKFRLTTDPKRKRLSAAEQEAFTFVADFYPRHPMAQLDA